MDGEGTLDPVRAGFVQRIAGTDVGEKVLPVDGIEFHIRLLVEGVDLWPVSYTHLGAGTNNPVAKAQKKIQDFVKASTKQIPPKELEEIQLD